MRARGVLGRHARISVAGEELRLEVLGSAPGSDVTLNGSIVKSAALAAGDRIAIGEATITLLNGPAPNPHRMSAPPARGRDALSVATAALSPLAPSDVAVAPAAPAVSVPVAAAPRPAAVPGPRYAPAPAESARRPEERPVSDPWSGFFECLHRPVPFEDLLQEIAAFVASATPVHSLAFVSLLPPNEGEAIAALWKGTLPRLSARTLADARGRTSSWEALEAGARLRVFPVSRPGGDPVGLLLVPAETVTDPVLLDFMAHAAAAVGFVHGERSEAVFGERGASSAPASSGATLEDPLAQLVGGSLPMSNLKASLSRVASARAPILLVGDVGSGKTLVAETLHALSPRRARPLVRVSATAASAQALEEDLLGSPAAGDRRRRVGRLFEADGGTLLVEELGDLPAPTQALLFRLLEAREVTAPGGRTVPVDVRVIGTTSRPLTRAVEDGAFRDDLYFRISALTLRIPPLKDRKEDLPALLDALATRHGGPAAEQFDVEAMNALLNYQYPGNVRELENEVRRLAAQVGAGAITLPDLDQKFSGEHVELALKESDDLKEIVEKVERQVIERVMRKVRGNQSLGARLLNISRGSLIAKMKEYDIKDFRYL
ncbi:MAG: sigma 54-interacting transcriptional regulator, partial [Acidobacteriota bacterium]|nr:sigma 54-interacting transcriptional regulator [Acidobacteriota bacterium]